mgnify:CR=1 FL=1
MYCQPTELIFFVFFFFQKFFPPPPPVAEAEAHAIEIISGHQAQADEECHKLDEELDNLRKRNELNCSEAEERFRQLVEEEEKKLEEKTREVSDVSLEIRHISW